jgi:predicted transcriptional regulator
VFLCQFWKHTETHPGNTGPPHGRNGRKSRKLLLFESPDPLDSQTMMAPKAANPNPDRARRSGDTTVAVATEAPAPAPHETTPAGVVVPSPAAAAPARAPGAFGLMPMRSTGLQQPQVGGKRTASVVREDIGWQCVEITDNADSKNPRWKCRGCQNFYSGGVTKVIDHVLGRNRSTKCTGTDADFLALADKVKRSEAAKEQKKAQTQRIVNVNTAAELPVSNSGGKLTVARPSKQPVLNFNASHVDGCDAAIAEFFYACNIPAAVVDHPKFVQMVSTLKAAPPSYKKPTRQALLGSLLDGTVARLQRDLKPLRDAIVRDCATIVSDGWDSVSRDHLINFLYGNASCLLFDGTVELTDEDGESADFVAELLRQCIERNGRFACVQVVTDTCSVMKAAWKLLQVEYPWLTATCCGTHVLSLELKDLGKISDVATIIAQVRICPP